MLRKLLVLCMFFVLLTGCETKADNDDDDNNIDFRAEMREFVINISSYARTYKPGFIVIPQNGNELLTLSNDGVGPAASTYISAIDGTAREDLYYGYDNDNVATSSADSDYMEDYLNLGKAAGLQVMVIDYCSDAAKIADSYSHSDTNGYISFAAIRRELDTIPGTGTYYPYNVSSDNITTLIQAKNFLYLINPSSYSNKSDFINAVKATNYDAIVIDLFFNDLTLTASDISELKTKANGGKRLVICYMSIGEAENYRYYWDNLWSIRPPSWLGKENPDWEGNYKVAYWNPDWQKIIYGSNSSYLKKILDAGFDGVYLDIIDAFEYFENFED